MNSERQEHGYNHTPEFIVEFIIRSINDILASDLFQLTEGLASKDLKILDFATGIGTYIYEIYKYALMSSKSNQEKQLLFDEHLIKNVYGFDIHKEAISQARNNISQLLLKENIDLLANHNLNLYNIDTLAELDNETVKLNEKEKTFIILGTPPFNSQLQNDTYKKLNLLLNDYISNQIVFRKHLYDSNIQFIRYAQYKLNESKQGIIAILCNDSFLDGNSFLEMRKSLYNDFDQINIFKIQGNSRVNFVKGESRVVPVTVGVSIIIFVKVKKKINKQINYFSLIENKLFSESDKINFIKNNSHNSIIWKTIPLNSKFTFIDNRLIKETSLDIYKNETHIKQPYSIKQIHIKNFKGIQDLNLKLPIDSQWFFLTGENAIGKTSILQALAIGLYDREGSLLKRSYRNYLPMQSFPQIAVELYAKEQLIINETSNLDNFYRLEDFVAYGPIRTELAEDWETSVEDTFFNSKTVLFNIENKLIELDGSSQLKEFQSLIISTLKELIPNLAEIIIRPDIRKKGKEVIYKELNNRGYLKFHDLAMGMRNIIGLFGDLFINLSKEKNIKSTHDVEGIVIIDEFDNHLHPKWQRMLVEKLTKLFPKVQFIVSTHSPIPLLGAPPDKTVIFNVNRRKEEGIIVTRLEKVENELANLLPNVILTSPAFGLDNIKSSYNKDIRDIIVDDNYNDRSKYTALEKEIDGLFEKGNWENHDLFKEEL